MINNALENITEGVVNALKEGFIKLLTWIGTGIISGSYWICTIIAIASLILYIMGYKQAGKYVGLSFLLYFILQCIKVVL